MNGLIGLGGMLALLLVLGVAVGCINHQYFSPRWLLTAALLVADNDVHLTSAYRLLPDLIGGE